MLIDIQDRQLFFWLQDRSDDKDEATFKKAQQLLIPPKSQAAPATAPTAAAVSAPTAAATAAPRTTASGSSISVQALQNILADLTAGQGQRVSLQALLGSHALLAALNEDRAFYPARLEEHLPPTQEGNTRDIVDEVRNPQVSQQLPCCRRPWRTPVASMSDNCIWRLLASKCVRSRRVPAATLGRCCQENAQ